MKKCPECGNPSYDGAPVCGNCGYTFPKPKVKAQKEESIFKKDSKPRKSNDEDSTIEIIKKNKLVIGAILLITLIVIGIIIATGPDTTDNTADQITGSDKFTAGVFSFTCPSNWEEVDGYDELHEGAVFFNGSNGTGIEYYNVTSEFSSINEVNNQRISTAFENGDYVNTVEQIQLDGRDASNVIIENYDGTYTRYVSFLADGYLHVIKINGNTYDSVTSDEIESVIQSADIA